MVVLVGLGVYPKPILDFINPSIEQTNSIVRDHDPTPSVFEQSQTNATSPCYRYADYQPGGRCVINFVTTAETTGSSN
jgi:hypothetical protein